MIKGTFNTIHFGKSGEFGGNVPVWARIYRRLVSGGYFDLKKTNPLTGQTFKAGDLIPAGTMLKYSAPGGELTIVPNDAEAVTGVNGLLDNDVLIPDNAVVATGAVVISGRIYADRVGCNLEGAEVGLPAAVESLLPMIEFVREA